LDLYFQKIRSFGKVLDFTEIDPGLQFCEDILFKTGFNNES